jgi:glyoxylase-like metal-dependent hydrolase (beta-lactamase superfamily II)
VTRAAATITAPEVNIPLEDNFNDILAKAQRGLKLTDAQLAKKTGLSEADIAAAKAGTVNEAVLRKLAPALGLGAERLVASAKKSWYPAARAISGVACFNTPFQDYHVNAYLIWDAKTKQAVAFDTGSDCGGMLQTATRMGLNISLILLTHTHTDHIVELDRLKKTTGAPAFVSEHDLIDGAEPFAWGRSFQVGSLAIETRQTSGHSPGGTTFVVRGLERQVAVVGDAIFAGSMGSGLVSWQEALRNNRQQILTLPDETLLCCGHGPLTTVGEEKKHNPFFPEFGR